MSLRWRIALGFALVALATAAVIALATPPIVTQGFADVDQDEVALPATSGSIQTAVANNEDSEDSGATATQAPATSGSSGPTPAGQAEETTILRLLLAVAGAAVAASLLGLLAAGRLVRPLTRLEEAAGAVARGDLGKRSGLAERSDEFGQLGRTFDSMAGQLQLADETRRRFLQDAAHELKTPLAVIDATSSAILDGVYTPERRHIETIRDQSRVLARIVDDLRTISLAEGGNLPLRPRPQDVRAVLDSVAAGFEARAAAGQVKLTVQAQDGLIVEADPDRLRQMLGALVDNALRHTPAGGAVRMVASASMAASKTGAQQPVVRLAVEDTGPGIPEEALPRIFERFFQADPSRSRGIGTSGLGLSIVRALAEAHGARVGAENRNEGGARLWVELAAARQA
ncbi:MAG TPA: HAMP domain-containing sensor histidine kinase [Candidatus Limnocylindrales bacterium]